MYRQKTIAKWLAVILLLTLIIACYVVLSAVLGKKGDNVAGADNQTEDVGGEPAPPDSGDAPSDEDMPSPFVPTYSEFPRAATTVGEAQVNFIGGEGEERLLDSVYYMGRRLVLFDSDSTQYDVKEAGIHIAVMDGATLERTVRVASGESYVATALLGRGLAVLTTDGARTRIRLYDDKLALSGSAETDAYASYGMLQSGTQLKLYASDGEYIHALTVSPSLSVSRSNFAKRLPFARFDLLAALGDTDLVVASNDDGMYVMTFSSNAGFIIKNELLNHSFVQFLPHSGDNLSALYVLSRYDGGLTVSSFDYSLNMLASRSVEGASEGALLSVGSNLLLVSDIGNMSFCAHLDPQYTPALSYDTRYAALFPSSALRFEAVRGSGDMLAVTDGTNLAVIKVADGAVAVIADTAAPERSYMALYAGGNLWLLLDGERAMGADGFENSDVFLIYLLTDKMQ